MASAMCRYIAFIFILTAGLCNASTGHNPHDLAMAKRHELWMAEHGRVYKDEIEKAMRFEIFKQNVKYIEDFNNAREHSYTLGINLFADLTNKEFSATYASGFKTPYGEFERSLRSIKYETVEEKEEEEEVLNYTTIPDSVDWRADGAVTSVKLQVACSCCWAMTAAAAIEGLHKIKKGVLYDLSVQQLVDCTGIGNDCTGGHATRAFFYVVFNGGLTTSANYPYVDTQNKCNATNEKQIVASIKNFQSCGGGEAQLRAAVAKQPVVVAVQAGDDFQFYNEGIFNGTCGPVINHAVVAVGYGEEGGEKFWIMKNSWSKNWGEDGYMRMQRDDGTPEGLCGIFSSPVYPTM